MSRGFSNYPVSSVNLSVNRNSTPLTNISGETKFSAGGYSVSGSFTALLRPSIYTLITTHLLSNLTTFSITPIASIVLSTDTTSYTLTNLVLNNCELRGATKDFIQTNFSFVAQKVSNEGSSEVTSYNDTPAIFYNTVVTANASTYYTSFSMKVERPIDTEHFILGKETLYLPNDQYIQAGPTMITGTLTGNRSGIFNTSIVRTSGDDDPSATIYTLPSTSCKIQMSCGTIDLKKIYLTESSLSGQGRQKFETSVNFAVDLSGTAPITF